jgi:hypothetical protein
MEKFMSIKHNKIRNTGILFELLVRRIAADVLDGKSDSFAVRLVREYFHPKSELGKELQLYRTFFNTPKLSENKAFNILDLIVARRKTLNERTLMMQKFNLIKEIKNNCDLKQFMAGRVPSYKVYASIYKLFESSEEIMEIQDVVKSRFLVIEHLKGELKEEQIIKESSYVNAMREQDEEIRFLSYKILLERFNEKYSNFNNQQKQLLREYINKGTDVEPFKAYVAKEASMLSSNITKLAGRIKSEVTRIKLYEVISQLKGIQAKPTIKENHITALLIAYQLVDDMKGLR